MATRKKKSVDVSQQDELRHAMEVLGMTRAEFAARISVPIRTLDKWLLPSESSDFRALPAMGRAYVREILEWHRQQQGVDPNESDD
ncbi:TPA: transcriptional regulator [Burkholderia cenocepacia]|uniref:transcriptional regulator n=1 Tax=Burkholderia cepacia complex TaxID=87882 RepID=UPI001CF4089C|nr:MULTISPECIES: transcriptional regulator [Burkholderia cepacia complex]MCA8082067.1 transcriptional regulator [Burkholderia cepacia]MEB2603454.1 transcriptional regulator [Burkholderia cenocepacia]